MYEIIEVPKLNEKLIAKVLAHIEEDLRRYDQNDVARMYAEGKGIPPCGTKACFGGWAKILSVPVSKRLKLFNGAPSEGQSSGSTFDLSDSRDLLGLTDGEAEFLFDAASGNPRDDLKTIKERLHDIRLGRQVVEAINKAHNQLKEAEGLFNVGDYNPTKESKI